MNSRAEVANIEGIRLQTMHGHVGATGEVACWEPGGTGARKW